MHRSTGAGRPWQVARRHVGGRQSRLPPDGGTCGNRTGCGSGARRQWRPASGRWSMTSERGGSGMRGLGSHDLRRANG